MRKIGGGGGEEDRVWEEDGVGRSMELWRNISVEVYISLNSCLIF